MQAGLVRPEQAGRRGLVALISQIFRESACFESVGLHPPLLAGLHRPSLTDACPRTLGLASWLVG